MKLKTIILTLGAALVLSAPAMALEVQPRLNKQVLDSYYLAGRNITLLKHRALTVRHSRDYKPMAIKVRVRVK